MPDQSTLTIAKLLVEHIISHHGEPMELLSDRGPAFAYDQIHRKLQVNHHFSLVETHSY